MLKSGDLVRCKKFYKKSHIIFYEGSTYKVIHIYNQPYPFCGVDVTYQGGGNVYLTKEAFEEYFYSEKEMRMLKLNKIKNNLK